MSIPNSLSDEQAERIGKAIAEDFRLPHSIMNADRYATNSGTYSNKGVARRAYRMIQEGLR